MSKEAMKLALEASKDECKQYAIEQVQEILEQAISEAAKQEQGEPVAWRLESGQAVWFERTDPEASSALPNDVTAIPLYTTPQQRKPLTDEQIYEIHENSSNLMELTRAIEAAHDIKE
jgi:hypothetical protein